MHPDRAVAHVALKFGLWRQGGDRIHDHHADGTGTDKRIHDLQRLLARVGLRNQQLIQVDAQLLCILRVQSMFGIHKSADATLFLFFRDRVQRQRRLAGRFRTVNLDHPALWQTTDPQRNIQPQRSCRCRLDIGHLVITAELHDGALAELPLDLRQRAFQRLFLVRGLLVSHFEEFCRCHMSCPYSMRPAGRQSLLFVLFVFSLLMRSKEEHCNINFHLAASS